MIRDHANRESHGQKCRGENSQLSQTIQSSVTELGIGPPYERPGEQHEQASATYAQLVCRIPTLDIGRTATGIGSLYCPVASSRARVVALF